MSSVFFVLNIVAAEEMGVDINDPGAFERLEQEGKLDEKLEAKLQE